MHTSIVIVNWNTRDLITKCVSFVRKNTRPTHELIVVDNGSCDGSAAAIKEMEGPGLEAVLLDENLGYAGGNNRGIEVAKGELVCLLNSDAFVTPGWLEGLQTCMTRTSAGMVGPWTNRCKGRQRHKLKYRRIPKWMRPYKKVDYLSFFCVLIRREVFENIGLLDERFGLGTFEDDDFCLRAREAGYRLVIDSRTWVWHEAHATMEANQLHDDHLIERNRKIYQNKWGKPPER